MTDQRPDPIRIGFVLHVMQVAGAEILVSETIRRLGSRLDPVVLCLDGIGQLGQQMLAEGVPVVALGRKPGIDFGAARLLAHEIRARRLEIVHAHQYTPFFYTALARLISPKRVHVIMTEHGRHHPDVVSLRRRVMNRLILSRLADEVTGVCEFSARSLAEVDGFGGRTIDVIENGVEIGRYARMADTRTLRARLQLDPARRYVICVARLHPVKDHATLLRAFAFVARQCGDVDLLLAGDGQLRSELERDANRLGIAGRVRFLGVRHDVADLLQASDVFALTSVSEAASITLLEAMACGMPAVITAVGGNPELVRHGQDGLLVPRGDDREIARALLDLLANPARARAMGESARLRVHSRFRLDDTIRRYYRRYLAAAERLRGDRHEAAAA